MKIFTKTLCGMLLNGPLLLISVALLLPNLTNAQQAGDLDLTFSQDGIQTTAVGINGSEAYAVALQPDGKIVVAGRATNEDYDTGIAVARYNSDGTLDNTFSGDGMLITYIGTFDARANAVAIQADGKIVVAGYATSNYAVLRYNTDGTLDNTFSGDGIQSTDIGGYTDEASAIAIQPDGKIVVAGTSANQLPPFTDMSVARYNTNGTLDFTFSTDGILKISMGNQDDGARSVAIQPDGKIVVVGGYDNTSDKGFFLLRLNSDGSGDATLSTGISLRADVGGDGYAMSLAIQPDGKLVAAGYGYPTAGSREIALVRWDGEGSVGGADADSTFSDDGKVFTSIGSDWESGASIALLSDGKIVVAGYTADGSDRDFALLCYNSDGTLDNTFSGDGIVTTDIALGDEGRAMVVQPDGKIVVAGKSYASFAIARYHSSMVTGIASESEHTGLEVYPNPSNGLFNVVMDGMDGTVSLSVYDLQGREVVAHSLTVRGRTNHTIDLSSFATGVYTLQMNTTTGILTQKLVRE